MENSLLGLSYWEDGTFQTALLVQLTVHPGCQLRVQLGFTPQIFGSSLCTLLHRLLDFLAAQKLDSRKECYKRTTQSVIARQPPLKSHLLDSFGECQTCWPRPESAGRWLPQDMSTRKNRSPGMTKVIVYHSHLRKHLHQGRFWMQHPKSHTYKI